MGSGARPTARSGASGSRSGGCAIGQPGRRCGAFHPALVAGAERRVCCAAALPAVSLQAPKPDGWGHRGSGQRLADLRRDTRFGLLRLIDRHLAR